MGSSHGDASNYNINGKLVSECKVDELKQELEKRGLKKAGVKKDLIQRLCEDMEREKKSAESLNIPEQKPSQDEEENPETAEEKDKPMGTTNDQGKNGEDNSQTETNKNEGDAEVEDGEITVTEEEKKDEQKEPEKNRKISLAKLKSNTTPVPSSRKRKWSTYKKKPSVVISTDSLKELIPGVQLASTPALEAVMDLDDDKEDEDTTQEKGKEVEEEEEKEKESEDNASENKQDDQSSNKKMRIVQIEQSRTVKLKNIIAIDDKVQGENNEMEVSSNDKDTPNNGIIEGTGSVNRDEEAPSSPESSENKFKPERQVSPPRNPPSNILHVSNLVRPFTQKQLDQILSNYGTTVEGGFWINKIKSHCYVTYSTVEEATTARNALHAQRWPTTSPKILNVDFANNDPMFEDTEGVLGKPKPTEETKDAEKEKVAKVKEHKRHKEKKESKPKEENAANLLDKLFRKTTTEPHLYWLPLTKEQIVKKEFEREERRKQRELAVEQQDDKQKNERLKGKEQETDKEKRETGREKSPDVSRGKAREIGREKEREIGRGKEREIGRGKEREIGREKAVEIGREKERETSRGGDRKPFRENRTSSPPSRSRPDRRSPDVRRRSSPASRDDRKR